MLRCAVGDSLDMPKLIGLLSGMFPVVGDGSNACFTLFHKTVSDWIADKSKSRQTVAKDGKISLYWLQELCEKLDIDPVMYVDCFARLCSETYNLHKFQNLLSDCKDDNGEELKKCLDGPNKVFKTILKHMQGPGRTAEGELKYDFYVDEHMSQVEFSKYMLSFIGLKAPCDIPNDEITITLDLQLDNMLGGYVLKHLVHHLVDAGFVKLAQTLLMQLPWLLACIKHRGCGIFGILADIHYALSVQQGDSKISDEGLQTAVQDTSFELVFKAIALSASSIRNANSGRQISVLFVLHLVGRLRSIAKPSICMEHFVSACLQWLQLEHDTYPVKYELTNPETVVLHRLHVGGVHGREKVCLTKDVRTLVVLSGSRRIRGTFKAWNLINGEQIRSPKELTSSVTSICIVDAADRTIVAAAVDKTIVFWDIHNGEKCLQTITAHDHEEIVSLCSVSVDSETFVVSLAADYEIKMWSCVSFQCGKTLQKRCTIDTESWGPTPPRLYTSCKGRYFISTFRFHVDLGIENPESDAYVLWDAADGVFVAAVDLSFEDGLCYPFTLIKDGSVLVCGTREGEIKVWDLKHKICMLTFPGHARWIRSIVITPDGRHLVSQCLDSIFKIWDTTKWECVRSIQSSDGSEYSVSVSNNLVLLALHQRIGAINAYDFSRVTDTHVDKTESSNTASVACISPDDSFVVSGSQHGMKVWDAMSGECKYTVEGIGHILSIAISSDCSRMMSASCSVVRVWNYDSTSLHLLAECGQSYCENAVFISRVLMSKATGDRVVFASGDSILVWRAEDPNTTAELKNTVDIMSFRSMCLSDDGRRCVIGSKVVQVWDADTRERTQTLEIRDDNNDDIQFVCVSSDCRRIVAVSQHALVTVWDSSSSSLDGYTRTNTCQLGRHVFASKRVVFAAMSYDGGRIAVKWQGGYTLWVVGSPIPRIKTIPNSPFYAHCVEYELKIKLGELLKESSSLLTLLYRYGVNSRYGIDEDYLSNRTLVILDREHGYARLRIFRCCIKAVVPLSHNHTL